MRNPSTRSRRRHHITRLKIIATVQHHISTRQKLINISLRQTLTHRQHLNQRIQRAQRLCGRLSLRITHPGVRMDHLAVQIRSIHEVIINHHNLTDTGTRQVQQRGCTQATGTQHHYACALERQLSLIPHFGQNQLTRIERTLSGRELARTARGVRRHRGSSHQVVEVACNFRNPSLKENKPAREKSP